MLIRLRFRSSIWIRFVFTPWGSSAAYAQFKVFMTLFPVILEAVTQMCSVKRCSRKFHIITGKHLFKKRLWHRCFPVNFVKFPRTPYFIEHLWWLLLSFMSLIARYLPLWGIHYFNFLKRVHLFSNENFFWQDKQNCTWKVVT